jgi:hypothetical protein
MRQQNQSTAPVAPKPPVETPMVLKAINLTFRTMERRARLYRNLVIAVSLTTMASVALAIILRRWAALLGVLALPAYVCGYVSLDNRIVRAWCDRVLAMRDEGGLNVAQLEQILTALRRIPDATLHSMFAMLGSTEL